MKVAEHYLRGRYFKEDICAEMELHQRLNYVEAVVCGLGTALLAVRPMVAAKIICSIFAVLC